jgi:thiamine transport system ATP-binding protein
MVSVRAVDISKRFGDFLAVDHVNIEAKDKELVTLLGPSGCGKTTTLRIISGLVKPDTGKVYFGEKDVTNVPPHKRNIGFVFQKVALFPHMNVYKNVAFGLKMRKFPKNEIDRRVKEVLKLVRMEGFEERMPSQLSGGQVQRIDIARVLATDPEVLLFDEPLGHLDAKLRDDLKYEIRRIQKETGKTAIYVTHDQAEAFAISDKVYVMNHGRVQQIGTPLELYLNPQSDFVADFIGTSNFLEGTIAEVTEDPKGKDNVFEAKIERSTFLGTNTRLMIGLGNRLLKVDLYGPDRFKMVDAVGFSKFHIRRFTIIKKT